MADALASGASDSNIVRVQPPSPAPNYKGEFMVHFKHYKNGATLIYRHVKRRHTSVVAGFVFGRNRDKFPEPSAHFCEHMFFKETETRNKKQLRQDILDTFTMKNGRTGLSYTEIDFCRANKKLEECFALASDMLLNTKFSNKCVESERGVIRQELVQALNNPNRLHGFAKIRSLTSEYNKNTMVLGSEEEINAITPKTLKHFRDETFVSQNFVISIVGGISCSRAIHLANKYFINKLKSNPSYTIDRTMDAEYNKPGNMNIEFYPFNKSICSIIFKLDKELVSIKTVQTMKMLSGICNSVDGKLNGKLRDKGLIYTGYLTYYDDPDHEYMEIRWECSNDNVNKCIETIGEVLKDLRKNKLEDSLIEKKIENYKLSRDEASARNIYPSRLFTRYLLYGKEDFSKKLSKEYRKTYENLTAQDLQGFCKNIFSKPENIHVVILTGEKEPKFYSYEEIQNILTSDKKVKGK